MNVEEAMQVGLQTQYTSFEYRYDAEGRTGIEGDMKKTRNCLVVKV